MKLGRAGRAGLAGHGAISPAPKAAGSSKRTRTNVSSQYFMWCADQVSFQEPTGRSATRHKQEASRALWGREEKPPSKTEAQTLTKLAFVEGRGGGADRGARRRPVSAPAPTFPPTRTAAQPSRRSAAASTTIELTRVTTHSQGRSAFSLARHL